MDSMELEREKGITIQSAATHCRWGDNHINIIDTPGHVDFTVQVQRALRVLDGAILLVCGASGVQPQTMTVFKQMERYSVPRIIFVNKLDRMGANPWSSIQQVHQKLNIPSAAIQIPIGIQDGLNGIIDLIKMEAVFFEGNSGQNIQRKPIPQEFLELAKEKRILLIETLAQIDPKIEEQYLNEEQPSIDQLKQSIRRQTIALKFSPILMGSAYRNKGVQLAIDGVVDFLPNPSQRKNKALQINREKQQEKQIQMVNDIKKPFIGLAFKLQENKFGQLTYIRIYQGKVKKGDLIFNTSTKKRVKVSRMVRMHSNEMQDINQAGAGDIFALFGVDCASGQTFSTLQDVSMRSMHVPQAVMSLNIKPKKITELSRFMNALNRFVRQDPTFRLRQNLESEQMIISGMGQLHLQIYAQRLRRQYGVDVQVGHPSVNYRQTIAGNARFNYTHKKQSGGAGQYAKVIGYIEPIPIEQNPSRKCQFVDKTQGQNIPNQYVPAIQKAFHQACQKGPQTGYPVTSVRFVLEDGQTHVVDSSSLAFALATKYAFREAFKKASPQILEPIMDVGVQVPAQFSNSIMATLVKRKGSVTNTESGYEIFSISADVPLANMFGYATELRSQTQGMGQFSMQYVKHQAVNAFDAQQIAIKYQEKLKSQKNSEA